MTWSLDQIRTLYKKPLFQLISEAHDMHRKFYSIGEVQKCTLLSFKTGGCAEDCKYCPQAARYATSVTPLPLMQEAEMMTCAQEAKRLGASRICIGAAWRGVREGKAFETLLSIVKKLTEEGLEVCCTLGLLSQKHADQLREAGLYAYNHNLDSSERFYRTIISTRTYNDRLTTLHRVRKAGMTLCSGGILGMGETDEDRIALLHTLIPLSPESVPLNFLIPIPGTPLEKKPPLPIWEMLRMIATARITMPQAMIRLAAGREQRSDEEQALCFFAGANSIFLGETLLTAPNTTIEDDERLFSLLGLTSKKRRAKLESHS